MKKLAFTIIEIMVCMVLIGIIAAIVLSNLKTESLTEKTQKAKLNKYIALAQETFAKIMENEKTACPTGTFIGKSAGTTFTTLYKEDGETTIDPEGLINLMAKYIKFEKTGVNFKDYSNFSNDSSIKAGILPGGVAFGISIGHQDCVQYKLPGETGYTTPAKEFNPATNTRETQKCIGRLHIDVDGTKGDAKEGKDVIRIGIGKNGIAF